MDQLENFLADQGVIAVHIMAQLTRFVVRKEMTKEEAATLAIDLAEALYAEMVKRD